VSVCSPGTDTDSSYSFRSFRSFSMQMSRAINGHFLSNSVPLIIIQSFETTHSHLLTASYNTVSTRRKLFYWMILFVSRS